MRDRLSDRLRRIVAEEAPGVPPVVVPPGARRAWRRLMTEAERATKGRGCQVRDGGVERLDVVIDGLGAALVAEQVARRFQGQGWRAMVTPGRGSATVRLVRED